MNVKRKENIEFINNHNLKKEDIKQILLNLKTNDFCYATLDKKNKNVILYVFAPTIMLKSEEIKMYIKFRIYDTLPSTTIVISFHSLNYKIKYAFK